jgi:hypothetical protein
MFPARAATHIRTTSALGTALSIIPEPAQAGREARDCAYNLFCNRHLPELRCAVPEDRPIPHFLNPEKWTFERALRPSDPPPPGFHPRAAYAGVRFNGFYLFQLTGTRERTTASPYPASG